MEERIIIEGSLLEKAIKSDSESLSLIFNQFLPEDETILHADYYGYFGFWFVGFHSFSCLTGKRIASLQVGPFKRVAYRDGFYENTTSGGVFQPSKFWLYVNIFLAIILSFSFIPVILYSFFNFILYELFGLYDIYEYSSGSIVFSIIFSVLLFPFIINSFTMFFYRFNPCGLACWVRERNPIVILVSRDKMKKANLLYRTWSNLREDRAKYIKSKYN